VQRKEAGTILPYFGNRAFAGFGPRTQEDLVRGEGGRASAAFCIDARGESRQKRVDG
jgi:hypothetical protein